MSKSDYLQIVCINYFPSVKSVNTFIFVITRPRSKTDLTIHFYILLSHVELEDDFLHAKIILKSAL